VKEKEPAVPRGLYITLHASIYIHMTQFPSSRRLLVFSSLWPGMCILEAVSG
jgi:hypothetical protein